VNFLAERWGTDSKTVWTAILVVGWTLGYVTPDEIGNVLPSLPVNPVVEERLDGLDESILAHQEGFNKIHARLNELEKKSSSRR
jgi:hypothetical protein